jgi:membrane-associated phospholipid phosphatase
MAGYSIADALPSAKLPTFFSPSKRVTLSYVNLHHCRYIIPLTVAQLHLRLCHNIVCPAPCNVFLGQSNSGRVLLGGFLALDAIEPYHQQFSLRNYTLQYKYAVHERVPNLALFIIAVISPAAIITIYTLVIDGIFSHQVSGRKRKYTWKERLWELNCGILGLGLAISLQYAIVASLKNAIGKPRPDLVDRCQPKEGSADPLPFGLSNSAICTQTNNAILKDGFRSFPSGHSSSKLCQVGCDHIDLTSP